MPIDVRGMPEVIWAVRRELARFLLRVAQGESDAVAKRLREIADVFECGQPPEPKP